MKVFLRRPVTSKSSYSVDWHYLILYCRTRFRHRANRPSTAYFISSACGTASTKFIHQFINVCKIVKRPYLVSYLGNANVTKISMNSWYKFFPKTIRDLLINILYAMLWRFSIFLAVSSSTEFLTWSSMISFTSTRLTTFIISSFSKYSITGCLDHHNIFLSFLVNYL